MSKDDTIKIETESFDYFKKELSSLIFSCFSELVKESNLSLAEEITPTYLINMLERPPESSLGDYAFPCFRFARTFRKKPDLIAKEIGERLLEKESSFISEFKVVGAFLNIFSDTKDSC